MVAIRGFTPIKDGPVLESPALQLDPERNTSMFNMSVTVEGKLHFEFRRVHMFIAMVEVESSAVCLEWPQNATTMLITAISEHAEVGPIRFGNFSCDTLLVNGE